MAMGGPIAPGSQVMQEILRESSLFLTLSPSHVFHSCPPVEDHGSMVIHMKEGDLVILLS